MRMCMGTVRALLTHIAAEQFYGTKHEAKIVVLEVLDVGLYNFFFE